MPDVQLPVTLPLPPPPRLATIRLEPYHDRMGGVQSQDPWGAIISNERISFTSLVSQALPAATRWKERELAVFSAGVQHGHVSALPSLNVRQRLTNPVEQPTEVLAQAVRLPAIHQLVRRMDHFNQPLVVWRLISGNHRELGRGVGLFPSYAVAAANATAAQKAAQDLTITFVQNQQARDYGWYVSLRGRPVLMASAWYPTIRDRDRSALAALDLLGGARLLETVIRHGHRHLPVEFPPELLRAGAPGVERLPEAPLPAFTKRSPDRRFFLAKQFEMPGSAAADS
ncbi:hypothetical protein [Pseudarthrobacter sulfonivorans]|nr:hypothetical protein [Pseudarthrobacter sulfonivorans]